MVAPNPFAGQTQQQTQPTQQAVNPFAGQQPKQQQAAPIAQPLENIEKPLPKGAKSWDPFGNPYFGDGLGGMLKKWKYNYTKDIKTVTDEQWQELRSGWDELNKPAQHIEGGRFSDSPEAAQQAQERGKMFTDALGQTFSTWWQAGTSDDSVLSAPLKAVGATVTLIGDLFSVPAQKFEQALGAGEGFREAANEITSPLPQLDQNKFTEFVEKFTPVGVLYDFTRIALSSSDNKWDTVSTKIEEGWQSGRIFYSQIFNPMLKEQFLQAYRAGEDPALIAMRLQNPLAELVGQLVLDPLNLVGAFGKASKVAKELDAAHDATVASGLLKTEKGVEALKAMDDATDAISTDKALTMLAEAQAEVVSKVTGESKLLNVKYTVDSLTTSSRQNAIVTKGKQLLGNMALVLKEQGYGYDGIAEAVWYGIRSVAKNADEMKTGLNGLSHLPNSHMWLADDYVETFSVLRKMMEGESGVLDGSRLQKLMKVANPAEFAEEATKILAGAAKSQFPDVSELGQTAQLVRKAAKEGGEVSQKTRDMAKAYENLPNHVKYLDKIDGTLSKYVKNPINNVLSKFYFNFQGGVAVRNIVSNNELILLDQGIGAWVKDGEYFTTAKNVEFLKGTFGVMPESASGFKSLVSSMTESKPLLFGKWMEKGEEAGAARVVASSVRSTFDKMIPKAMPNLANAVQNGIISQTQLSWLTKRLSKTGDVEKTLQEFRELYKVGAVEAWRNLDHVSDFERKSLEAFDYWDDIEDLARRGANSTDEVEQVFEKIRKSIESRSELATKDVIGLSADHPNAETWGDLMKAVEDGHLDAGQQQVFTALMEGAEQARLEYQTLLDNVAQKAMDALNQEGKLQEAQKIGQEMNRVRETLRAAAPATAKETRAITQDAWRWTEEIKALKKPVFEDLKKFWTKAGLNGEPPLDLNRQSLLKEIWKQRFEKVSASWNSSFDAIVNESETVLQQMGKVVDATELQSMAARTRNMTARAQALRSATFEKGALKIRPVQDVAEVAKQYGVTTEEILNAINNKLPEGTQKFGKIEDVPTKQVMDVLEQARVEKGLPEIEGIAVPPPHPMGTQPSMARTWNESANGLKYTLDRVKNGILEKWGVTDDAAKYSPELENVLQTVKNEMAPKMGEIKAVALRVAEQNRNFTLLNYGAKTYGDVALSYIMPFHFFYTRSYKNWLSRIATNPEIVAGYGKYKDALESINQDLPDWYKQQVDVTKLLGIETDHPLFFNLESTFNPLYGLTGTDFNDPAKRTNWFTASVDDMGKFGPSIWAPIQMAIAATLYKNGETDAASRWGNRLIPETAQIKALSSYTAPFFREMGGQWSNWLGHPIELDPAVGFFSGGIDPYERGRMGYAAAQLIEQGVPAEVVQEQFAAQEGEYWDKAYQMAVQSRAPSSISSWFLGVGFKPRSTNDVMVEEMYTNLNRLYQLSDMLSPDQYKAEWDKLRSQYPPGLVDTVLLAKKGGDKRDAAYAFNVLGRLPPAQMSDVFKAIGISQEDVSKFYDSKGFADPKVKFTATEKQRFMAAIIDLGAMLKIPNDATREEWGEVRTQYADALSEVKAQYGDDIWDKVSLWYDLKDDNRQAADEFSQQHPEVLEALNMKGGLIASNPMLAAYYGGVDTIESYVSGKVRNQLTQEFGYDIYQVQTEYFNVTDQKAYMRQHPELKKFWKRKDELERQSQKMMLDFASALPDMKGAEFRDDFTPESGVQQTLFENLQTQPSIQSWDTLSEGMPEWLQDEIFNYWTGEKDLSKRAKSEMDYLAKQKGFYNADDLLMSTGYALQQGQQTQQQQPTNPFAQP